MIDLFDQSLNDAPGDFRVSMSPDHEENENHLSTERIASPGHAEQVNNSSPERAASPTIAMVEDENNEGNEVHLPAHDRYIFNF